MKHLVVHPAVVAVNFPPASNLFILTSRSGVVAHSSRRTRDHYTAEFPPRRGRYNILVPAGTDGEMSVSAGAKRFVRNLKIDGASATPTCSAPATWRAPPGITSGMAKADFA